MAASFMKLLLNESISVTKFSEKEQDKNTFEIFDTQVLVAGGDCRALNIILTVRCLLFLHYCFHSEISSITMTVNTAT